MSSSVMTIISASSLLELVLFTKLVLVATAGNFNKDVDITWGNGRAKILNRGQALTLSLDNSSGSGFQSKNKFLFGRFDLQLKLVPGNSAGTVTTFFMASEGPGHDEIDFEFLGNASGQPYTVHTNVFARGKGDREQQFRLWFDPTKAFHTYSIVWNPQRIIFLVDNSPIRVFTNNEASGVPYPKSQPMRVLCSLWNADDWATQGGRVKTDWSLAPFTATYRNVNFNGDACVNSMPGSSPAKTCSPTNPSNSAWRSQSLDGNGRKRLKWVQQKFMIYNYCKDFQRFPQGVSPECKRTTL